MTPAPRTPTPAEGSELHTYWVRKRQAEEKKQRELAEKAQQAQRPRQAQRAS